MYLKSQKRKVKRLEMFANAVSIASKKATGNANLQADINTALATLLDAENADRPLPAPPATEIHYDGRFWISDDEPSLIG